MTNLTVNNMKLGVFGVHLTIHLVRIMANCQLTNYMTFWNEQKLILRDVMCITCKLQDMKISHGCNFVTNFKRK